MCVLASLSESYKCTSSEELGDSLSYWMTLKSVNKSLGVYKCAPNLWIRINLPALSNSKVAKTLLVQSRETDSAPKQQ